MLLNFLSDFRAMFKDDEIALLLSPEDVYDPSLGIDDGYTFFIHERKSRKKIGYISLRIGESAHLYYLGHIGYRIDEPYRGHGYAARACRLLLPLMRKLDMYSVCITANPDNTASRKTCENIGCVLESIVRVPAAFRGVCPDATEKCRYILIIPDETERD